MSEYSEILLTKSGHTATVTMDRPDALNAITPTMLDELNDAVTKVEEDDQVRFVVLTGAGRAFSGGVDLKALGERELVNGKVGDILDLPARALTGRLSSMPKITIAKVNGFCFTGALEIAMSCDLIAVANEARLGDTHGKFGLRPTWGLSQRLPALVGIARARELSFSARIFDGVEAQRWGLAALGGPLEELDNLVTSVIDKMAANSSESFVAYKDLYEATERLSIDQGLVYEADSEYLFTDTGERLADFR